MWSGRAPLAGRPPLRTSMPDRTTNASQNYLLRVSLRLLLTLLTLLCIGLAIWTQRAHQQKAIVDRIKQTGGGVHYDFEPWADGMVVEGSRVPQRLRDLVGVDYFHEVTDVTTLEPAVLSRLHQFRHLKSLTIRNNSLTDAELAPIVRLRA
jgi:hypothetical protein